jgi:predicted phosphodiesterase
MKIKALFGLLILSAAVAYAAPASSEDLGVLVLGDTGKGTAGQKQVADALPEFCRTRRCDFAILLGDNFYNSGVKSLNDPKFKTHFEDLYAKLGIEFWAVLGNHDYGFALSRGNIQAQIDYTRQSSSWRMPTRYYSFTTDGIEFIGLDTVALPRDSHQQEWLSRQLQKPKNGHRVVFGHFPVHSSGQHGDTPYMRDTIAPQFCGQADIYMSGHDHHLEHLKTDCGVHLVLSGAGAESREVSPSNPRSLFAASKIGFSYLSRTAGSELNVQYFDAQLNRLAGFSLDKN